MEAAVAGRHGVFTEEARRTAGAAAVHIGCSSCIDLGGKEHYIAGK